MHYFIYSSSIGASLALGLFRLLTVYIWADWLCVSAYSLCSCGCYACLVLIALMLYANIMHFVIWEDWTHGLMISLSVASQRLWVQVRACAWILCLGFQSSSCCMPPYDLHAPSSTYFCGRHLCPFLLSEFLLPALFLCELCVAPGRVSVLRPCSHHSILWLRASLLASIALGVLHYRA